MERCHLSCCWALEVGMGVRVEQQTLAKHGLDYVIDEYPPRKTKDMRAFLP